MSVVKRNVIANLVGGAVLAALTVVITPMQINILGLEAFGIVGFITTLQIAFTAFDLGLSSTLTRELAADTSKDKQRSTELLRTASTIYWCSAVAIGVVIAAFAGQIAQRWFNATSTISVATLEQSLRVIALYLALRWPVAVYVGILTGLQRMEMLNLLKVTVASVRLIGGVVVLLHWHSLYAFLIWTLLNALLEVLAYALVCRWIHPSMPMRPGVSWMALRRVWRFSLSMNGLAILTVLLVQIDRLLISNMLTLEALGRYSLAYTTAAIIPAVISAIGSAVLPSFAAAHGQGSSESLLERYDVASRLMLYVIGLVTAVLIFFGEPLLTLWVNATAAAGASRPLALLALGFLGSAVVSNAYQIAIATGQPNVALKISFLSAPPYVLCLYWLIVELGIDGAALAWLLLNAGYVVFLLPRVHHRILNIAVGPYLLHVLMPPAALALVCFGPAKLLADRAPQSTQPFG